MKKFFYFIIFCLVFYILLFKVRIITIAQNMYFELNKNSQKSSVAKKYIKQTPFDIVNKLNKTLPSSNNFPDYIDIFDKNSKIAIDKHPELFSKFISKLKNNNKLKIKKLIPDGADYIAILNTGKNLRFRRIKNEAFALSILY